jgi:hypothetical protein
MTMSTWSLVVILGAAPVAALRSFIDKPNLLGNLELEDTSNNWISLDQETEFLQVLDGKAARRLDSTSSEGSSTVNPYATQAFVDGEHEYDEYQQAWRYLGFIIDCDSSNDDDDRSGSGSYDGGTGEGCNRYVVWAAVRTVGEKKLLFFVASIYLFCNGLSDLLMLILICTIDSKTHIFL